MNHSGTPHLGAPAVLAGAALVSSWSLPSSMAVSKPAEVFAEAIAPGIGIAASAGARGPRGPEGGAKGIVTDEPGELRRERRGVSRRDEDARARVHDLQRSADRGRDDRPPRAQSLDEGEPEALRPGVGLAVDVGC